MMLTSLRPQDRAYAPKEATKIIREIEQILEDSRELRRDFDRAKVCSCVLKFRWTMDLLNIHDRIVKLKEQMDEENI